MTGLLLACAVWCVTPVCDDDRLAWTHIPGGETDMLRIEAPGFGPVDVPVEEESVLVGCVDGPLAVTYLNHLGDPLYVRSFPWEREVGRFKESGPCRVHAPGEGDSCPTVCE